MIVSIDATAKVDIVGFFCSILDGPQDFSEYLVVPQLEDLS